MTASKNPENITVQLFRPLSYLLVWLKTPTIFIKMWNFSSNSRFFASAKCLKSVKNSRIEGFKKPKPKTSKTKTSKAKTWKTKTT